ncbi:MAG: hypothetical protein ACREU6_00650 [Steroidobacteraceae bacterium]
MNMDALAVDLHLVDDRPAEMAIDHGQRERVRDIEVRSPVNIQHDA